MGDPPRPAEDPVDVSETLEATKARGHQVFEGKLAKKHLSFPERAMAAALRVREGDFRRWEEIKDWAARLADDLQP